MKVGVVGGGPAGSYFAWLAARSGLVVSLFDPKTRPEKPCGGGVTPRALRDFPWIYDLPVPRKEIASLEFSSPRGRVAPVQLDVPFFIFPRALFDNAILERALEAGVEYLPRRVVGLKERGRGWTLCYDGGEVDVDVVVGADGAASIIRKSLLGRFQPECLTLTAGYYVCGDFGDTAVCEFLADRPGYIWILPRHDHASIGIGCEFNGNRPEEMRSKVQEFMKRRLNGKRAEIQGSYGALIPCPRRTSALNGRVCGPNWALLGDAAGFADPITGEGIYYALLSAEKLHRALLAEDLLAYETLWRGCIGKELRLAASYYALFYSHGFSEKMVDLASRSPSVNTVLKNLVLGIQDYSSLKRRLKHGLPRIVWETVVHSLSRRPLSA